MQKFITVVLMTTLGIAACGGDEDDTPPPPPPTGSAPFVSPPAQPPVAQPPGQVMVTVTANSTPPGATVTGGGRQLGITPFTTQVPVPAPAPGEVQTFAFTFELQGYQSATLTASPVNNTISITAALAPVVQPEVVSTTVNADADGDGDEAGELRIVGQGGGPIYDHHTTTGSAVVDRDCTIDRLRVRLNGTHTYFGDLYITLRDPNGNSYSLARGNRGSNPFRTHTVRRAEGRQARGRWTLAIEDRLAQDSGVLRAWSLSLRCR
jgi:hypothetical protein